MSEVVPGATEELPPQEEYEPEIGQTSQTPQTFSSMSPFKSKSAQKDTLGMFAIVIAVVAIVVSLALVVMSYTLSAT